MTAVDANALCHYNENLSHLGICFHFANLSQIKNFFVVAAHLSVFVYLAPFVQDHDVAADVSVVLQVLNYTCYMCFYIYIFKYSLSAVNYTKS